ncbi:hypothetical protein GCM10008904_27930 [Paraclostridium ghonii]|uniref:Fascin-like domain-containing protein n=1 Tax=Paraclostridium ghonii TaxID=29358 RepID=A0ABU0N3L9_9FIRM|nr:hypothetical protein [Paeniclostridium ghonii]MDQ0557720.1 hypothetical protein [Paeniclostridium ghonii]
MKENNIHWMYFKYLYKRGTISKDTYEKAIRDLNNGRNKLVTIKSSFNDKYVSVNGEGGRLVANQDVIQLSDRFILNDLGSGNVLIQTQEGYYVKIDTDSDFLLASVSEKYNATIFTLIPINNKEVALKSDNGYYVKVEENGYLIANDLIQNEKNCFKIKEVTKIEYTDIVMISLSEERFVTAIDGGGSYLCATEFNQSEHEEFTILQFLDNNAIIQTQKGYYVRIGEGEVLIADTRKIEEASLFKGENIGNFVRILKTLDGYIVRVRDIDKYLVADSKEITESSKFNIYKSIRPGVK